MTVRCPRCGTVYRRPPRAEDATFRCARCRHVFEAAAAEEPAFVAAAAGADEDDTEEAFVLDEEDAVSGPARRRRAAREAAPDAEEAPHPVTPARFAIRALVLVTLCYAVVSGWLLADPGRARALLRGVPLIGAGLAAPRLPIAAVQLARVKGEYQRVRGDHLVFVVSGTAVNASAVPVRGIQVQAFVRGEETRRQAVFCGAAPRDVRDLSLREIALLQTIEPPRDWALQPGDETTFLVVFTDLPATPHEFGAEVVSVATRAFVSGRVGRRG